MADVAKQTVKLGGKYYRTGDTLPPIKDAKVRERLIAVGAITPGSGAKTETKAPAKTKKVGQSQDKAPQGPGTGEGGDVDPDAIPSDFPGAEALAKAGITTFSALDDVEDLTSIDGIGETTARKIEAALDALETE